METENQRITNCWNCFRNIHQEYLSWTEVHPAYHHIRNLSCVLTSSTDLMSIFSIMRLLFSVLKMYRFMIELMLRLYSTCTGSPSKDTSKIVVSYTQHILIHNMTTLTLMKTTTVLCCVARRNRRRQRRRRRSAAPLYTYECLLILNNKVNEDRIYLLQFNSSYQRTSDSILFG